MSGHERTDGKRRTEPESRSDKGQEAMNANENRRMDAERVRDALQGHPWPEASGSMLARIRAIPGKKPERRAVGRPRSIGIEAISTIAVALVLAAMLLRGTGDRVAPSDSVDGAGSAAGPAVGPAVQPAVDLAPGDETSEGSELGLQTTIDLSFDATSAVAEGQMVVIGGLDGLVVAGLSPSGQVASLRAYQPAPPATLGLLGDADVAWLAAQKTRGDLDAARSLLAEASTSWRVMAVAIRGRHAYAAIRWPEDYGIAALHVIDLESEDLALVDAIPLLPMSTEAAAGVTIEAMAPAGDRLVVSSSRGLLTVDISDPTAVVAAPIAAELQQMTFGLGLAPDGHRAWTSNPQIDAGKLLTLDLAGPTGPRIAGQRATDVALFDLATDGRTAFVTTGGEQDHLRVFDLRQGGEPRQLAALRLAADAVLPLVLLGDRLVVGAAGMHGDAFLEPGDPEPAYPAPADRPGLGQVGLLVYDVSQPAEPSLVQTISLPGPAWRLSESDGRVLAPVEGARQVRIYAPMPIAQDPVE